MPKDWLERSMDSDESVWPLFSVNQLNTWNHCEYLGWFTYVKEYSSKGSTNPGFQVGGMVHEMADLYYRLPPNSTEREKVSKLYALERVGLVQEDPEQSLLLKRATIVADRYFKEYAPAADKGHTVEAVEEYVKVPFKTPKGRNYHLQGYVDLRTRYSKRRIVWDHKTMDGDRFFSETQLSMDIQIPAYIGILRVLLNESINNGMFNMFNTYDYKKPWAQPLEKYFKRQPMYYPDALIDRFLKEIGKEIDSILEITVPRRTLSKNCAGCSFYGPCNAGMNGLSMTPILDSQFKKREERHG